MIYYAHAKGLQAVLRLAREQKYSNFDISSNLRGESSSKVIGNLNFPVTKILSREKAMQDSDDDGDDLPGEAGSDGIS